MIWIVIGIFLLSLVNVILLTKLYAYFMHPKNTESAPLSKPPAQLMKPWTKKSKTAPKINDDVSAWNKEKQIEINR